MQAPLTTSTVITPSGLTRTVGTQKTAVLTDPFDPLSLVTETKTTTVNSRSLTSVYDAATRTTTTTTAVGRISTTTVDAQGRVVYSAPPGILPTEMVYDAQGRISETAQGTRQTTFGYHPQTGYLQSVTDALTQETLYERDALGRATRQTLPDGHFIDFGYDGKGNLTSLTPPQKPVHEMQYTPVDLIASYDPPAVTGSGTTSTTYGYNLDRQLESVLRPDAQAISRTYDPTTGELTTLTLPTGIATYTYDPTTRQLTGISGPYGVDLTYAYDGHLRTDVTWSGAISGTVHTDYDDDFRAASETVNGSGAVSFGYDDDGLMTSAGALTRTLDPATAQLTATAVGDVSDSYTYNAYGELETYDASYLGSSMLSTTYTRDALGRISSKTETVEGETHSFVYRYDLRGRLYQVERDGLVEEEYTYDANGNRDGGTYDDQDRLLAYGGKTYTYTANGELSSCSDGTQYSYDAQGALLSVDLPDGRLVEYLIDGQGRRVGKKVDGVLQWGLVYRSQLQPVARLDGSGVVVDRYVYGSSGNVPDYVVRGGSVYRIITDHLGSLRLVVDASTGEVMQRMAYDAYGVVLVDWAASGWEVLPFGFAGGVYDRDTGLVRFGARDYDASVGRWRSKDPIGFAGEDSNVFEYASGNPVNFIDPAGQKPSWCGAVTAGGGGAAGALVCFKIGGIVPAVICGIVTGVGGYLLGDCICEWWEDDCDCDEPKDEECQDYCDEPVGDAA